MKKIIRNNQVLHVFRAVAYVAFLAVFLFAESALAQSLPITTDSRIKTLVYNPNEVYQLKFHYGYQSFIEFADDEEIEMISIGESFAWRLTPAGKRLFIRPLEIAAHTNMAIITNRRTYQFDIRSGEYNGKADEELVYTIRFYYPEVGSSLPIPPQLSVPNLPSPPPAPLAAPSASLVPPPPSRFAVKTPMTPAKVHLPLPDELKIDDVKTKLNFGYQISGNAENINPIKIFDDGSNTYFQFKNGNMVVPTINSVDLYGNEKPLSYVIKDNYVMVRGTNIQYTLRLADAMLCIFNSNPKF